MRRIPTAQLAKGKVVKAEEICLFYLLRYFDISPIPAVNRSFIKSLHDEKSPVWRLFMTDADEVNTLEDADRICLGEMRVHDLDPGLFRSDFSWHKDYYSGFEWPPKPFNRIYDPNDSGYDLNIPFELSRLQFVPSLLKAHRVNHDIKYISGLCRLLDSWIEKNPYGFGVNWWSGMEVGLRAVNLTLAVSYLAGKIPEEKLGRYLRILWRHGLYIYKYDVLKDKAKNKNNHFLGSMLGMLAVSMCFQGRKASSLMHYAMEALKEEIPRQFHRDGGNFESATGYHQFSLEVVLTSVLLIRIFSSGSSSEETADRFLEDRIQERLRAGLNLAWDYMACYCESPHVGDSSDCRVLVTKAYFSRTARDHSFLFEMGRYAIEYERPEDRDVISRIYPDSGYGCFRNGHYGIVAFAGPKGTEGRGGHGHNDKCSFVLQAGGRPVFIDSGTYIYNPDTQARYLLKRGKAHNIVIVDGMEQCDISPAMVFGIAGDIHTEINMFNDKKNIRFRMGHDGYRRVPGLGRISREIIPQGTKLQFIESLEGTGEHQVSLFFNLHPDVKIEKAENPLVMLIGTITVTVIFPSMFSVFIEDSIYSNCYHSSVKSKRINAGGSISLPNSWRTEIHIS